MITTLEDLRMSIAMVLEDHGVRLCLGAPQREQFLDEVTCFRTSQSRRFTFRFDRTFTVGCILSLTITEESKGKYTVSTSLNWSGTGRGLASAQASVALYQEVISLAALIETIA